MAVHVAGSENMYRNTNSNNNTNGNSNNSTNNTKSNDFYHPCFTFLPFTYTQAWFLCRCRPR